MAKKKATVPEILKQVEASKGNIAAIARYFGVSRGTIHNRMKESKKLEEALNSARESMIDNVESKLYQEALAGNTTAMIFFLKTQGKSRGYTERQEVEVRDWRDKIIDALRENKITAGQVKERFGDKLAKELFAKAGVNAS